MAVDSRGNSHKAAGRPDGGQFDGKAGGGSDDDLEVPTTAATVAPDEGWWASLESDPEAAAGPEMDGEPETPSDPEGDGPDEDWWRSLEDDSKAAGPKTDGGDEDRRRSADDGADLPLELRKIREDIMRITGRKEIKDALSDMDMPDRCKVIRTLPFTYKVMASELTPDPDALPDFATAAAALPYTAGDVRSGCLRKRVAMGDVRAVVATALYGDVETRYQLSKSPLADHPSVAAALGLEKARTDAEGDPDSVRNLVKWALGADDVWDARSFIVRRPKETWTGIVRAMPFDYIPELADLTDDPDKAKDLDSMLAGLPYTKDCPPDRLRDQASLGDVRAAAALAAYGDADARRWLHTMPVGEHRAVRMALDAKRDVDTASPKPAPRSADSIADMAERATHATNLWEARKMVSAQPKKTRVAVIRAMPFSRRAMMADLAGDPDEARGYRSLLDMLPYTEDSPTDRLLDMADRGDVRAAAALAAYGSDAERQELKKLPVAGHRAVMMALDEHEPKGRRHAPPAAPAAPAPRPAAPKPPSRPAPAPRTPKAPPAPSKPRYASNRAPRYSRPHKPTLRERMSHGLAGLRTIWSGVWEKWAAVFRGRPSRP